MILIEMLDNLTTFINRLAQLIETQLRQREDAMQQWHEANPELSKRCKQAAVIFNSVLKDVLEEILDLIPDSLRIGRIDPDLDIKECDGCLKTHGPAENAAR